MCETHADFDKRSAAKIPAPGHSLDLSTAMVGFREDRLITGPVVRSLRHAELLDEVLTDRELVDVGVALGQALQVHEKLLDQLHLVRDHRLRLRDVEL